MEILLTGQYKYLIWFVIAIVLIYIPYMYFWVKRKKKKAAIYEHEHPEAVKVYIRRTEINDHLTIISVNDESPVIHTKGINHGFYLLPGKNVIHVTYQWAIINLISISGLQTITVDNEELHVTVEKGKEYVISYNHTSEQYEFEEK